MGVNSSNDLGEECRKCQTSLHLNFCPCSGYDVITLAGQPEVVSCDISMIMKLDAGSGEGMLAGTRMEYTNLYGLIVIHLS